MGPDRIMISGVSDTATPNGCLEPVTSRASGLTKGLLMDVHLPGRQDSWEEQPSSDRWDSCRMLRPQATILRMAAVLQPWQILVAGWVDCCASTIGPQRRSISRPGYGSAEKMDSTA